MPERRIHDWEYRVLVPGDHDKVLVKAQDFMAAKAAFLSLAATRPRVPLCLLHRARVVMRHEPSPAPLRPPPILDL